MNNFSYALLVLSLFLVATMIGIPIHRGLAFGSAASTDPLISSHPIQGNITGDVQDAEGIESIINEIRNKIGNTSSSDRITLADCVDYSNKSRAIIVSCNLTLNDIHKAIGNDEIIRIEPNEQGVWFLNSSLDVQKGATLTISAEEGVKWLRISSDNNLANSSKSDNGYYGPHRIRVHGSLNLDGTKITSWNYDTGNYTTQNIEGSIPRPYIVIEPRADVSLLTDTEIAFMGYNGAGKQGLSMYGGDGTILEGNIIHDLWFGFFSDNLGNLTIQNNTIYQNIKYGVYPRTGSGSAIENNHIIDNNVGLTCSQGCHEMLIRKNEIHNNEVAGVVFSRNVSDSIAINNNVSNSGIGIAASESYANDISGNVVSNNRFGLQLKGGSVNNILNNNTVANTSECGILVTGNAKDNTILHNSVYDSAKNGICLSQGSESNRFSSNLIDSPGNFGISVKDRDSEDNVFENNIIRLAENGIVVQNNTKTTFLNTILHEIEDIQYIVSTNSTLNLEKNPPTSSIIRSTGTSYNMISIKDSGSITLISSSQDDESGQELFTSSVHNSDDSPYTRRLSPGAIIELDSRPY